MDVDFDLSNNEDSLRNRSLRTTETMSRTWSRELGEAGAVGSRPQSTSMGRRSRVQTAGK